MTNEKISDEIKTLKPRAHTFESRLKEDNKFLVSMIDDPLKTLKEYGFEADEKKVSMLNAASENIRQRAAKVFSEIGGMKAADQNCNACQSCASYFKDRVIDR
jgi:hypothetical protein